MCKSKMKTHATEPNNSSPRTPRRTSRSTATTSSSSSSSAAPTRQTTTQSSEALRFSKTSDPSTSYGNFPYTTTGTGTGTGTGSSYSSASLSSLRDSLPENAYIYDFSEISSATNNFLAKRFSSSSSSWRCCLRGKQVIVFQRKFRRLIETSELRQKLSLVCASHHMSLVKLLGASVSGDHIYLVYDFVNGANLADCLRNSRNPSFTILSNWKSRMQVATDLAQGLEYIHHYTGSKLSHVHNHIKSSSLIVTEPSFNAKICHFGTAELCGEIDHHIDDDELCGSNEMSSSKLKRLDSRTNRFQGTLGYMSPEFQNQGVATQKSDVFAFGVVILELLSGEEPLKYRMDRERGGDYRRVSVIETAREAMESDQPGRVRRWIDKRLKDSFPLEAAEKLVRLALDCVNVDPDKRPDMRHVSGKISQFYLNSIKWAGKMDANVSANITVSLGPR